MSEFTGLLGFPTALLPAIKAFLAGMPPLVRFMMLLSIFLLVPSLSRLLRLPGLVGLVLAGLLLGSSGLDVWPDNRSLLQTFAEVGKLLVLFYAGMELDLDKLRHSSTRALAFGFATLVIPAVTGIALGHAFGYGPIAALLIGAIVASHTLVGYPIVQRLGLTGLESVAVTVAGTILAETIALLVLAVCTATHLQGFTLPLLAVQVVKILAYAALVLYFANVVAVRTLHGREANRDLQVLVLLSIMLVASLLAELFHLEPIIGAFLAGAAVSRSLRTGEARHHVEVLGNTLFVPAFFFYLGLGIDATRLTSALVTHWQLPVALLIAVLASKFVAAWGCGHFFRYSLEERLVAWSLTTPHVVATLAMAVVAQETINAAGMPLLDQGFVDAVLFLLVVTATLGPIVTERYASRIATRNA